MYIPVFDIKDSYIIKHVLSYNTSCKLDDPYKMLFIDYDLARKSQSKNSENFSGITMNLNFPSLSTLKFEYYGETDIINFSGEVIYEGEFSNLVFSKTRYYDQYNVDNGTNYNVDDTVNIKFYNKEYETGTVFYEHTSYVPNDIWFVSGLTSFGTQWIVTGMTTTPGYVSGYTNWEVNNINEIFTYDVKINYTDSSTIRVDKKVEDYIFNNLLSYSDVYYKITSLNHCDKSYYSLYNMLNYKERIKNFNISFNSSGITLIPKYNEEDIYFDYDAYKIYLNSNTTPEYTFETNCLYNKYNLELFFNQFDNIDSSSIGIFDGYYTNSVSMINYTHGDYYITLQIPTTEYITPYTYIKLETNLSNEYNVLVIDKYEDLTGSYIKIISPLSIQSGESIDNIRNITILNDISSILQKTYENYNHDEYRELSINIRKKIYSTYAEKINLLESNVNIRKEISGLIFENVNKILVLKIFDPVDYVDNRLLYEPIEVMRIGKDKKTSIPIPITEISRGLTGDLLNPNIISVYILNSNVETLLVINSNVSE